MWIMYIKLIRLLKIATTGIATDEDCDSLKDIDWEKMFDLAASQMVVGMVYRAMTIIPREKGPKRVDFLTWYGRNNMVEYMNGELNKDAVALCEKLEADGFRCSVLKGQGVGMLYDSPLSRSSGDIDVLVDKPIEEVVEYVHRELPGAKMDVSSKHIEFPFFGKSVVELHFVPSLLACPSANKALQAFYQKEADAIYNNVVELPNGVGCIKAATVKFDAIHVLAHIFGHVFYEGIGVRQYMDYYFVLKHLDEADRAEVIEVLKQIGLYGFAGAVMYVLQEAFGLTRDKMIADPDVSRGKRLLKDILENGCLDENGQGHGGSAIKRFFGHSFRQIMFFDMCPSEALWSPINRINHFLWRKKNGYFK